MMRLSITVLASLISLSASAQTQTPAPTKQDDVVAELKALNQKVDGLQNAMKGPFRPPRVDDGVAFASPFPIACHYNCAGVAENICESMGYARGLPAETPPIQGVPAGAYSYFFCFGRK